MSPEQAKGMAAFFTMVIENEMPTNIRVFEAIPEDKSGYRPDDKARTALELARHMVVSDLWFADAVIDGSFEMPSEDAENAVSSVSQALALYKEKLPAALEKIKAMPGEQLAKPINMMGVFNFEAVIYLSFLIRHSVHHRGQLSTYLRPMGGKVPSIYGGSADQPFEMPAGAGN